jgi:hypothetical protein
MSRASAARCTRPSRADEVTVTVVVVVVVMDSPVTVTGPAELVTVCVDRLPSVAIVRRRPLPRFQTLSRSGSRSRRGVIIAHPWDLLR